MVGDRLEIARVPVQGGETSFIPTPLRLPLLVGILPDKTALIVADSMDHSTATFWRLPLHGGPIQPLSWLKNLHTFHFSFSPDARNVVFLQDNPSSLLVVPAGGGTPRRIFSTTSGYVHSPCWSPDGKSISFSWFDPDGADGTGAESLWIISPNGSDKRILVPPNGSPSGTWMPDGKRFVFAASQNSKRDIWMILTEHWLPLTKSKPIRLTNGTLNFDMPLPSIDGKRIFTFAKQNLGQAVRYDKEKNGFSPYLGGISANQIDFSRDGRWITYVSYPEETLWRSRIDGSERRQLTFSPSKADAPHWSPDGQRIAFRADEPGHAEKKIFLISRDGGAPQELFPDDKQEEGIPTWSPDGNRLVFGELRYHPDSIAIQIVNLNAREVTPVPNSRGLWTPRWSPDGRYLLALGADASTFVSKGIHLYDFETKKWKELTDHPVSEVAWSHDGQYIYFDLSIKPATDALFRIRAADALLEQVVDLRELQRSPGGGTGFSLMPDGSPLFLQEVRPKEIYALELR